MTNKENGRPAGLPLAVPEDPVTPKYVSYGPNFELNFSSMAFPWIEIHYVPPGWNDDDKAWSLRLKITSDYAACLLAALYDIREGVDWFQSGHFVSGSASFTFARLTKRILEPYYFPVGTRLIYTDCYDYVKDEEFWGVYDPQQLDPMISGDEDPSVKFERMYILDLFAASLDYVILDRLTRYSRRSWGSNQ